MRLIIFAQEDAPKNSDCACRMNKYLPQYFHSVNKSGEPMSVHMAHCRCTICSDHSPNFRLWESYGKLKAKELFEAISEERILKVSFAHNSISGQDPNSAKVSRRRCRSDVERS